MPEPTITTSADAAAEENDRVAGLPNGLLSSRRVADMAVPLAAADIFKGRYEKWSERAGGVILDSSGAGHQ